MLAPGSYTLEVAIQDRENGRFSTSKSPFTIKPVASDFSLSSLAVVREVVPGEPGGADDSLFRLKETTVVPALDGVVHGGKGAVASLFLQLYPSAASPAPVRLELELLQEGQPVVRTPLTLKASREPAQAEMISLDVSKLPAGAYDVRISGTQGEYRGETAARMTIVGGVPETGAALSAAEAEVHAQPAAELPAVPPNADQQRLLEETSRAVAQYSDHLPNFICTQVTRRLLDPVGKGQWRSLDESTQLLSYFDGKEHYHQMTTRSRASDSNSWSASMTSSGEFGSLLKQVFGQSAQAKFAWAKADRVRGRAVQVFTYSVDAAHSRYRVAYNSSRGQAPVFSPFHGLVYIDQETAVVRKLTLETDTLPEEFAVRRVALSLDYEDVAVGGNVYLLPLAASLDLSLHKKTVVRNEVNFRSYQRFTTDSRILSYGVEQP